MGPSVLHAAEVNQMTSMEPDDGSPATTSGTPYKKNSRWFIKSTLEVTGTNGV